MSSNVVLYKQAMSHVPTRAAETFLNLLQFINPILEKTSDISLVTFLFQSYCNIEINCPFIWALTINSI